MELLYELETQANELIVERMRRLSRMRYQATSRCANSAMWRCRDITAMSKP